MNSGKIVNDVQFNLMSRILRGFMCFALLLAEGRRAVEKEQKGQRRLLEFLPLSMYRQEGRSKRIIVEHLYPKDE